MAISNKELGKIIYFALSKTYLSAFEDATKGEASGYKPSSVSTTAQWDIEMTGDLQFSIVNPKGDIVIFLDAGTKKHIIKPKNKKMLRWVGEGNQQFFAKEIVHPGTKGRQFVNRILTDTVLEQKFADIVYEKMLKHL